MPPHFANSCPISLSSLWYLLRVYFNITISFLNLLMSLLKVIA